MDLCVRRVNPCAARAKQLKRQLVKNNLLKTEHLKMTGLRFSRERFDRSTKLTGKVCIVVGFLFLAAIMLGGNDLFGKKREFVNRNELRSDGADGYRFTPLVFAGAAKLQAVDILYYIFLGVAILSTCLFLCASRCAPVSSLGYQCAACCNENCLQPVSISRAGRFLSNRPYLTFGIFPLFLLVLHLAANLHWLFWCGVGIIPHDNCYFFVFDYRSLLVGPAGLIGLTVVLGAFFALGVGLFHAAAYCCCFEWVADDDKQPN